MIMRTTIIFAICLLLVGTLGASVIVPAPEGQPQREKFSALAYLPSGAGRAMVGAGATANIDLHLNAYTSDADAKVMANALIQGGPDALLRALDKAKTIGSIRLSGRVGFYDLKLIRSHRVEGGRRVYAVGDRPVGFLEAYVNNRSRDYPFGILQLDLKSNGKGKEEGTGTLIYAAKIKVLDGNAIDVETYGIDPIKLLGLRKL
jgi:hypothetical protein